MTLGQLKDKAPFVKEVPFDWTVDEGEFSKFVSEHYGKPYNFQQWEAVNGGGFNGSSLTLEVSGDTEDEVAEQELEKWLALEYVPNDNDRWQGYSEMNFYRKHTLDPEIIMWDLHRKGLVPKGIYLFKIEW